MVPTRVLESVSLLLIASAVPVLAGPTTHAMELAENGAVLFVDLDRGRLLRYHEDRLTLVSELKGVPASDVMQNLVLAVTGELYIGHKKSVWMVKPDGAVESAKPPAELKELFVNRPADLAPDGSVYLARDFKNIQRSLPGGDAHPVLTTDVISRIHTMSVTPYGRVFFANNAEIAKLTAEGEVEILQELEKERILGLAAAGENTLLVLRQREGEGPRLERLDAFGNAELLVSAEQIAAVSRDAPVQIATSGG